MSSIELCEGYIQPKLLRLKNIWGLHKYAVMWWVYDGTSLVYQYISSLIKTWIPPGFMALQTVLIGFDCLASILKGRTMEKTAAWQKGQSLIWDFFLHTNLLSHAVYWCPKAKYLDWLNQNHFRSLLKLLICWPKPDLQNLSGDEA